MIIILMYKLFLFYKPKGRRVKTKQRSCVKTYPLMTLGNRKHSGLV